MLRVAAAVLLAYSLFTGSVRAASAERKGQESGPHLTEQEFFQGLSITGVREAAQRRDWEAARRLFTAHLKNRSQPKWYLDWQGPITPEMLRTDPDAPGVTVEKAAKALEHEFNITDVTYRFDGPINWSYNPTFAPGSPWPQNGEPLLPMGRTLAYFRWKAAALRRAW